MGSIGFQVQLWSSKAMAGMRFSSSQLATAAAAPSEARLHSSIAGGSSIVQSRSLFMRSALLGLVTPGMFSAPQPALARSRISAIPEVRFAPHTSRFPKFLSSWFPKWFPQPPISQVLKTVEWPAEFPFKAEDFQRYDESSDTIFYDSPRFVTHIDDYAIKALSQYYASVFPPANTPGVAILDLCSSWISHYPKNYRQEKIVGLGLNDDELKRNEVLTDYVVQDLNVDPKLPFQDNSFDIITNAVSVDYLTKPLDIFKEMNRILKPGGLAAMSFSNRCFFTKAISVWTSTDDADHVWIVGSYFHFTGGYEPPQALDISPNPGRSDPMYVVYAKKASA